MSGLGVNVYVWASKVAPVDAVGVTVTWEPLTVTLRKWTTWADDVGALPPPQAEPIVVGLQPSAYLSALEHVVESPSGVAPPPPVVYSTRPLSPVLRW